MENKETNQEELDQIKLDQKELEEEKKKRRRYLLLILLLLLLLLLLCRCGRKLPTAILGEKIENGVTPGGYVESGNNTDENNVISNNSVEAIEEDNTTIVSNTTKKNKTTNKNTNTVTNTTSGTGGSSSSTSDDEQEIKKEIIVTSNNQKWTENLDIFSNETYNGQSIIYPGIENTYYFEITNASDIAVICDLKFKETNLENLPIEYKLKENGNYVRGSQTEYVTYDKLALDDISLEINAQNVYALEWKWIDDETSDNYYGDPEKDITYALQIIVQAEEKTSD